MPAEEGALLLDPLLCVDRCADCARYAVTRLLRPLARNAQAANVPTCFACSAERHKREVQVRGKVTVYIMHIARR